MIGMRMKCMSVTHTKFGINNFASAQFCIEVLSWMIEIWMNDHLVSDDNCNIVNLKCPVLFTRMTSNVRS